MFGSGSSGTGSISKGLFRSYYNASAASNNLLEKGDKKNGRHASQVDGDHEEPETVLETPDVTILPSLLVGEEIVARVQGVQVFQPLSSDKQGVIGELYVTNFKVSFQTITFPDHRLDHYHTIQDVWHPRWQGLLDIPLASISAIYRLSKNGRRKPLQMGPLKRLLIVCRNFRMEKFSLQQCAPRETQALAAALLGYVGPHDKERLFLYSTPARKSSMVPDKPPTKSAVKRTADFSTRSDWLNLLDYVDTSTWRITQANENFHLCSSLPKCFVVPASLGDDARLEGLCGQLGAADERRPLVWCWSSVQGAALCRMSNDMEKQTFAEAVKLSHPNRKSPIVYDVGTLAPSVKDIRKQYEALRDLVLVESFSALESSDDKWFVEVESTRWLHSVSRCLELAYTVSDALRKQTSAILKESGDRDVNGVVSSLVQLLLEPRTRTIKGFQRLIEKEFVALGHRFSERLGLLKTEPDRESPVFLLFLDCVFQLTHMFPASFEFSPAYLIRIYDTALLGVFRNFTTNCQRDVLGSTLLPTVNPAPWPSAWDVDYLTPAPGSRCVNGLFLAQQLLTALPVMERGVDGPPGVLTPVWGLAFVRVWRSLYLRFVPPLAAAGGGAEGAREEAVKRVCGEVAALWREVQGGAADTEGEEKRPSRRGSTASVASTRPAVEEPVGVVRRERQPSGASLLSAAGADARRRSQLLRPLTGTSGGSHAILTFQK